MLSLKHSFEESKPGKGMVMLILSGQKGNRKRKKKLLTKSRKSFADKRIFLYFAIW